MQRPHVHMLLGRILVGVLLSLHLGGAVHYSVVHHDVGADGRLVHGHRDDSPSALRAPDVTDVRGAEAHCAIADLQRSGTRVTPIVAGQVLAAPALAVARSVADAPPVARRLYRIAPKSSPPA